MKNCQSKFIIFKNKSGRYGGAQAVLEIQVEVGMGGGGWGDFLWNLKCNNNNYL